MKIVVNGKPFEAESESLVELLNLLGHSDTDVATAVNGEFVPITRRTDISLHVGDRVEVIAPMAGG